MVAARLTRVPPFENGLTLGDFLVPIRVGERAATWQRNALMVAIGTLLIIAGAWVSFSVPQLALGNVFVPANPYVPFSLQTFSVLFVGATLGFRRGLASTMLYLLLGCIGLPVFAIDAATGVHASGIDTIATIENGHLVLGATGGYLIGFVVAAGIVGRLAELGWDRSFRGSVAMMLIGTTAIYLVGLPWLAVAAGLSLSQTLQFGIWPFVPGDVVKLLVAAGHATHRLAAGLSPTARPLGMRTTRATVSAITAILLTIVVTVSIAGFTSTADAQVPVPLEGTTWRLAELSVAGAPTEIPADVVSTLRLSNGEATGSAACNAFFGTYQTSGSALTFGHIGSSRLACPEPSGSVETAYLQMFSLVTSYSIADASLSLLDASGDVLATYAPLTRIDLVGAWSVSAFAPPDAQLGRPIGGTELTLFLRSDGTLTGSSGCNRYGGAWAATTDGTIVFGPLATTLLACEDDLAAQESSYLAALESSTSWGMARDVMAFHDDAGSIVVILHRLDNLAFLGDWVAVSLADSTGANVPLTTTAPTITFNDDGTVNGTTGCNTLFGPYTVEIGTISIGPVATTRVACTSEALTTQENAYVTALDAAATWTIEDDLLILADSAGTTLATFARPGTIPPVTETPSPSPSPSPTRHLRAHRRRRPDLRAHRRRQSQQPSRRRPPSRRQSPRRSQQPRLRRSQRRNQHPSRRQSQLPSPPRNRRQLRHRSRQPPPPPSRRRNPHPSPRRSRPRLRHPSRLQLQHRSRLPSRLPSRPRSQRLRRLRNPPPSRHPSRRQVRRRPRRTR